MSDGSDLSTVPGLDRIPTQEAEESGLSCAEFQVHLRVRGLHDLLSLRMSCLTRGSGNKTAGDTWKSVANASMCLRPLPRLPRRMSETVEGVMPIALAAKAWEMPRSVSKCGSISGPARAGIG